MTSPGRNDDATASTSLKSTSFFAFIEPNFSPDSTLYFSTAQIVNHKVCSIFNISHKKKAGGYKFYNRDTSQRNWSWTSFAKEICSIVPTIMLKFTSQLSSYITFLVLLVGSSRAVPIDAIHPAPPERPSNHSNTAITMQSDNSTFEHRLKDIGIVAYLGAFASVTVVAVSLSVFKKISHWVVKHRERGFGLLSDIGCIAHVSLCEMEKLSAVPDTKCTCGTKLIQI
jgi:hypothetical protein